MSVEESDYVFNTRFSKGSLGPGAKTC